MAGTVASIRVALWQEPAWVALTAEAQLYALTCRALSAAGKVTEQRVSDLTGWDAEFIRRWREEVAASPFAYLLGNKRRPLAKKIRDAVYARDGRVCVYCGVTSNLQIDHRHPVALGGTDDMENLQVLCQPCNVRKGARLGVVQG